VPSASSARLATCAVPASISGAAVWWALATSHWSWWGISTLVPTNPESTSYGDLKAILATALCMRDGTDYTVCDPYGRDFTPYVVLPARILSVGGFDMTDVDRLGPSLAALYVVTIAGLGLVLARAWRGRTGTLVAAQVLLGVMAVTAPAMLGIERGQIEIIILALTVIALTLLTSGSRGWRAVGAAAGLASVVGKYLAIGLFAPFVRRGRPNRAALIALGLSVVFLALSWSQLQQAIATSGADKPATSQSQFGATALIATLLSDEPITGIPSPAVVDHWGAVRLASLVLVVAAIAIAAIAVPPSARRALAAEPVAYSMFVGGTGVLLLPYVLGASHDYRQVFLLPALVGALVWLSAAQGHARWVPGIVVLAIAVSLLTGASMILTPSDSIGPREVMWPKSALVVGDLSLLLTLAVGGGVWARGWVRRDA
jgi:hypothetical protein